MTSMKVVNGREQGCWAHPALYEIGKAIHCCGNMRPSDMLGPCSTRTYLKREEWCENCVASAALRELTAILEHAADRGCPCKNCASLRKFIKNGAENDRKYGFHDSQEGRKA